MNAYLGVKKIEAKRKISVPLWGDKAPMRWPPAAFPRRSAVLAQVLR